MSDTAMPSTGRVRGGRECVLCAAHDRRTPLESGHCCAGCHMHLARCLRDLSQTVVQAAAETIPAVRGATGGRVPPGSKPPIDLDHIAPHLALIELTKGDPDTRVTITDCLASWEMVIRAERLMTRYGPATEAHAGDTEHGWTTSEIALTGRAFTQAIGFLQRNLEWIITDPKFPLQQFDDEIGRSLATVRSMLIGRSRDCVVSCPTITDHGRCGQPITVRTWLPLEHDPSVGETTRCRACGAVRTAAQLVRAGGTEDTWASPEDLAEHFGVTARTLRRWAKSGSVRRKGGLYNWADVATYATLKNAGA